MGQETISQKCDVAIIGTGPYGLSLAAHLGRTGIDFRIFGKPMDLWRNHMPKGMMLKSEGFASNLSAPGGKSRLKDYCRIHGIAYAEQGLPIPLDDFIAYADWFTARHVSNLTEEMVTRLERHGAGFLLTLEDGARVAAQNVVLAVGITWFPVVPKEVSHLPSSLVTHSYDHRVVDQFVGRSVVVVGAGASAVNLAYELNEVGAGVSLLVRGQEVEYHAPPEERISSSFHKLRNPASPIGPGWRSFFCASLPGLFYHLPVKMRLRAVRSHLRPAAGWYMREKVESQVPIILGKSIKKGEDCGGKLSLHLSDGSRFNCDHLIAATGYRTDLQRLAFLSDDIRELISRPDCMLNVGRDFQTSLEGLYVVGPMIMENFGPLLRFMAGAGFAARRLTRIFRRKRMIHLFHPWLGGAHDIVRPESNGVLPLTASYLVKKHRN